MGESITLLYLCAKLFPLILSIFCTPFCLTTFIIGIININSCPIQPLIPIWILVIGIILFIPTVTCSLCLIPCTARYVSNSEEEKNEKLISRILSITGLLLAMWSILGAYWTFRIRHQYQSHDKTHSVDYCTQWIFKFVLISSIFIIVSNGIILILFSIRLILIVKRKVFSKYSTVTS